MKLKRIAVFVGLLSLFDVILFIALLLFVATDEKVSEIGRVLFFILKYIFGFPLVLINSKFPFFWKLRV